MNRTSIANLALTMIGENPIETLDEQTPMGQLITQVFNIAQEMLLRSHTWSRARCMDSLGYQEVKGSCYPYMYQLPKSCVRVCEIEPREVQFKIMGQVLYTQKKIDYVMYISSDVSLEGYDVSMCELLAIKIAELIAYKVTGKFNLRDALTQLYEQKLIVAKGQDATEDNNYRVYESLLESRGY